MKKSTTTAATANKNKRRIVVEEEENEEISPKKKQRLSVDVEEEKESVGKMVLFGGDPWAADFALLVKHFFTSESTPEEVNIVSFPSQLQKEIDHHTSAYLACL